MALPLAAQSSASNKTEAQTHFIQGVQEYKSADFDSAIRDLDHALQLDPALTLAELYLGATYASARVPNRQLPKDRDYADKAIRSYESVLKKEPANINAVVGLAGVLISTSDFPKAREQYLRAASLMQHPVVFYAVGAVDWILLNSKPPLSSVEQSRLIAEGLEYIDRALVLKPGYGEAMTYKNLLILQQAKLRSDPAERSRLTTEAAEWQKKSLEALRSVQQSGARWPPAIRDGATIFVPDFVPGAPPTLPQPGTMVPIEKAKVLP
jgi:tetratricopeptide (TPR) repeat protein